VLQSAAIGGNEPDDSGRSSSKPVGEVSSSSSSTIQDSDPEFLLKLVATSFALGAVVKYGSLLTSLPFTPSTGGALALVLGPPLMWSAWALLLKQK
jgi:hypothetical protein